MIGLMVAAAMAAGVGEPVCHGLSIATAVARYAQLARMIDARGVGQMYAADGVLMAGAEPITGPSEVKRFLGRFGAYKLSDYVMILDGTKRDDHGWQTYGSYSQHGTGPTGVAFEASGSFNARW